MASFQSFQTFVFLDIETTGLPHDQPRMAELCLFAVNRHSLQRSQMDILMTPQERLPRIIDKLTLCIDPQKPFTFEAQRITALSKQDLEENHKPPMNKAVVEALKGFLDRQAGPVCLVAHNGNGFDFPILRTELRQVGADLPGNTGCLDTLPAFRDLVKGPRMSYRLGDLYRHFYSQDPTRAHSAEGDVITLLLVFLAKAPELLLWATIHASSWGQISTLYLPRLNSSRN
ncbi:three prime repair exonuclease 2 [Elgaria multicarinata webbii]|uniref:three prime repair exonuclease 2 n=1 Tax=Elgaria multicarinata webbii TaxID=159646 RepID=UPI002FCD272F